MGKVDEIKVFKLNRQSMWAALEGFHTYIPAEAIPFLREEGSFDSFSLAPGQAVPTLADSDRELVGTGDKECPLCQGRLEITLESVGSQTGLRVLTQQRCCCIMYREFCRYWYDDSIIPANYRKVRLSTFEACYRAGFFKMGGFASKASFDVLHSVLKENVGTHSFLLYGRGGKGKSTSLVALYRCILNEVATDQYQLNPGVPRLWKTSCKRLADEMRTWACKPVDDSSASRPVPLPSVTENAILAAKRAGFRPALFLEEFDKFKTDSEFQLKEFHAILDQIYNAADEGSPKLSGFVVATSNLSPDELRQRLGPQYGEALVRRLSGAPHGIEIDFDAGKVKFNTNSAQPVRQAPPVQEVITIPDRTQVQPKAEEPPWTSAKPVALRQFDRGRHS